MQTPNFWHKRTLISYLLYPLSKLYEFGGHLRFKMAGSREPETIKTICVGNLIAGGTGKTPACIALSEILKAKGFKPVIISRGYKGKLNNVLVDPKKHTAKEVGDEALLLSKFCPVIINKDRRAGIQLGANLGFDIAITDDGFQNPYFYKDLSLITIDGTYGFGNGLIIPAGPLREPIKAGLKRADGIILIGKDVYNLKAKFKLPVISARMIPLASRLEGKYIAFCGIGNPEKFFDTLSNTNASLIRHYVFPDHHFYKSKEIEKMLTEGKGLAAKLITTSKDYVKIPKDLQGQIEVLEIALKFDNFEDLEELIDKKCQRK